MHKTPSVYLKNQGGITNISNCQSNVVTLTIDRLTLFAKKNKMAINVANITADEHIERDSTKKRSK